MREMISNMPFIYGVVGGVALSLASVVVASR